MLSHAFLVLLVSQVPDGNPIAMSAKKAVAVRDAGKPDAGVRAPDAGLVRGADAGVVATIDAGVAVPKPVMAPAVKTLVDRMQAFYETTSDFSADFRQDYFYKISKRTQTSTGTTRWAPRVTQ